MYRIRALHSQDIPRLAEIRPGFVATTKIAVERVGEAPYMSWQLTEVPLDRPFDKGRGYDFDSTEQANIRARHSKSTTLIEVVELSATRRLVGIMDVEEETWRNTAWIWNLMLDKSARGQGLGRQLLDRTIEWARHKRLRAILLETQSNNIHACRFYAHMGFELVGVHDLFYTNHDIERDEVALFWGYKL